MLRVTVLLLAPLLNCGSDAPAGEQEGIAAVDSTISQVDTLFAHLKPFRADLPTISLLMYNGVL